jgi:hypothetical protein
MPYELRFNDRQFRIENIVSGVLSRNDLQQSTAEAIELQHKHGAYHVMVDAKNLESVNSVTDLYELPKQYIEQGASRSTRIALVMPESETARKFIRFYENVCINRGWTVRSFETHGEAEKWLSLERP